MSEIDTMDLVTRQVEGHKFWATRQRGLAQGLQKHFRPEIESPMPEHVAGTNMMETVQ